ncbi:hypothetical protein P1X14_06695 [Sphingomonas sp. AOB5]|uniref:hypothetical protein n=1 Tax=Sphingomonas sp. AOB5 TaxID=3034017 RepID=UPI0023F9382D|nr:hypothetical protein [Sphingomonas sp. AOB5]MDF7774926.1 hypothetical protein [Sphingomonas sp. AOB5]
MIALLLSLAALPAQDMTQMRVRPTSEQAAVAEFEATCVANFRDVEGLKSAAAASSRGYAFDDKGPLDWRSWSSAYGGVYYYQGRPEGSAITPECNLTSYTRLAVDDDLLMSELRAMIARQNGAQVVRTSFRTRPVWRWRDAAGKPMAVIVALDPRTPQQITLSLRPGVADS